MQLECQDQIPKDLCSLGRESNLTRKDLLDTDVRFPPLASENRIRMFRMRNDLESLVQRTRQLIPVLWGDCEATNPADRGERTLLPWEHRPDLGCGSVLAYASAHLGSRIQRWALILRGAGRGAAQRPTSEQILDCRVGTK